MRITSRSAVKQARATPASCGWKARTTSSPTATSCISGSILSLSDSTHLTLVADRAEVLVDAEYDQDEFGGDARKHHADDHAGDRGQQQDESAERADRHRRQARENTGDAEQHDQADHQPVKGLDDRGGDEAVPLKQVLEIEHRWFSRQINLSRDESRLQQGLAPN